MQAGANAAGGCVADSNFGTVKGCTYASAYAEEAAAANAEVHVLATSLAIAENCPAQCADATSWSISSVEAAAEIMADAQASAEIEACAFGANTSPTALPACTGKNASLVCGLLYCYRELHGRHLHCEQSELPMLVVHDPVC